MITFRELCEIIPQMEPELWRACYPRMYRHADRYGSPKAAAVTIATAVNLMRESEYREAAPTTRNIYLASARLSEFGIPTFFIAPEFLAAASQTTPPADLLWSEINLPFEAAVLMLPRGAIVHPTDGAIDFVGYARVRAGRALRFPLDRCPAIALTQDTFFVFSTYTEVASCPMVDHVFNTSSHPHIGTGELLTGTHGRHGFLELSISQSDSELLATLTDLVFRILLAFDARPTLLSSGHRDGKHKKSQIEIWTPNIVGGNYRIAREPHGGTHSSPRLHWRRGHFRRQPFGERRAQIKTIWIDPVLIGGGE